MKKIDTMAQSIISACQNCKDDLGRMPLNAYEMSEEILRLRKVIEDMLTGFEEVADEIQYESDYNSPAYQTAKMKYNQFKDAPLYVKVNHEEED